MFEVYYFTLYKIEIYRYIRQQVFIKIQEPQKMFDSTTFFFAAFSNLATVNCKCTNVSEFSDYSPIHRLFLPHAEERATW